MNSTATRNSTLTVYLIDDDEAVLHSQIELMTAAGHQVDS
jgi:FixJ family two-component response regulator